MHTNKKCNKHLASVRQRGVSLIFNPGVVLARWGSSGVILLLNSIQTNVKMTALIPFTGFVPPVLHFGGHFYGEDDIIMARSQCTSARVHWRSAQPFRSFSFFEHGSKGDYHCDLCTYDRASAFMSPCSVARFRGLKASFRVWFETRGIDVYDAPDDTLTLHLPGVNEPFARMHVMIGDSEIEGPELGLQVHFTMLYEDQNEPPHPLVASLLGLDTETEMHARAHARARIAEDFQHRRINQWDEDAPAYYDLEDIHARVQFAKLTLRAQGTHAALNHLTGHIYQIISLFMARHKFADLGLHAMKEQVAPMRGLAIAALLASSDAQDMPERSRTALTVANMHFNTMLRRNHMIRAPDVHAYHSTRLELHTLHTYPPLARDLLVASVERNMVMRSVCPEWLTNSSTSASRRYYEPFLNRNVLADLVHDVYAAYTGIVGNHLVEARTYAEYRKSQAVLALTGLHGSDWHKGYRTLALTMHYCATAGIHLLMAQQNVDSIQGVGQHMEFAMEEDAEEENASDSGSESEDGSMTTLIADE